ncbi:MAG: hypothetical protein H7839_21260 [Magnetococcus sp. YQC-5]
MMQIPQTTPFQQIAKAIATEYGIPQTILTDWCTNIRKEKEADETVAKFYADTNFNMRQIVQKKMASLSFEALKTSVNQVASNNKIPEKTLNTWCNSFQEKIPYIFQQCQYHGEKDKHDISIAMERIYLTYQFLSEVLVASGVLSTWRGTTPNNLYHLSGDIVADVAIRVQRDKARFSYFHNIKENSVDPCKVAGLFMYWMAKLKPICFKYPQNTSLEEPEIYLNEYLAIIFSVTRCDQKKIFKNIPKIIQEELRYNLRYRSYSSDDLILLLRTLLSDS